MFIVDEIDGLNGYDDDGLNTGLNKRRKKGGKGTKVGNFLRKNVRARNINAKNLITAGTIAAGFIPGGGAATGFLKGTKAAKLAMKASKFMELSKVGKLAIKAKGLLKTQIGQLVMTKVKQGVPLNPSEAKFVEQVAVAQDQDPTTPNVLTPQEFNEATGGDPTKVQANAPMVPDAKLTPEQARTIAEINGIDPEVSNTPTKGQIETLSKLKDIPEENLKEEVKNQLEDASRGAGAEPTPKEDKKISPIMIGGAVLLAGGLIYAVSRKQ
ncbi:hypothetical protein [Flavobacterium sp.]|uniref:hypothetical protein n=1 Tax=Flavobacterium sp. TaxID=239 RepID=UPI003753B532